MKIRKTFVIIVGVVPVMFGLTLAGCSTKSVFSKKSSQEQELVIPDFPTAQQQFQFAKVYQNSALIAPELDRRRVQMDKIGQYYQRVLTNFPSDPNYVPLTYLELGDCAAQSDYFDQALQYYEQANAVSQDEFVQARSKYSIARIYDTTGRHVEAKAIYKGIMDTYSRTESGRVKDVVERAARNYVQVHEVKN